MNWNVEELKKLLDDIKKMPTSMEVKSDYNVLNYMIYYLDHSWNRDIVTLDSKECYDETLEFLSSNYDIIKRAVLEFCDFRVNPSGIFFFVGMKMDELDATVSNFFKYYNEKLSKEYINLKDGSRICLKSEKYPFSMAKGMTFQLCTTANSYVGVRYNKTIFSSSTLVHEIGHSYQFEGIKDYSSSDKKFNSIWSEAFPLFLENIYHMFLKNGTEKDIGRRLEYEFLDNFLALSDAIYTRYFNGNVNEFVSQFKSNHDTRYSVTRLCSYFLAFHLANEYFKNPSNNLADNFNSMIGKIDDDAILKVYGKKEVFDSPREVINRYRRGI